MKILPLLTFKPDAFPTFTFDKVDAAHTWVNRDGAPRDECFMSTTGAPYTYGSGRGERTYDPIPFSPLIFLLRDYVSERVGTSYEVCFSNRYVDKGKHLGWHADDSDSIDHTVGIAIVSFGAEREIWFREKKWHNDEESLRHREPAVQVAAMQADIAAPIEKLSLPHGSLCIMPPGFQQTHQHRIPKAGRDVGVRVSLTFRKLK